MIELKFPIALEEYRRPSKLNFALRSYEQSAGLAALTAGMRRNNVDEANGAPVWQHAQAIRVLLQEVGRQWLVAREKLVQQQPK
jgi:hypothetical protein